MCVHRGLGMEVRPQARIAWERCETSGEEQSPRVSNSPEWLKKKYSKELRQCSPGVVEQSEAGDVESSQ